MGTKLFQDLRKVFSLVGTWDLTFAPNQVWNHDVVNKGEVSNDSPIGLAYPSSNSTLFSEPVEFYGINVVNVDIVGMVARLNTPSALSSWPNIYFNNTWFFERLEFYEEAENLSYRDDLLLWISEFGTKQS